MMNIDESNGIVKESIYNNMTNNRTMKLVDEYGYYQYLVSYDLENNAVLFGFKSDDFNKVYDYSGKEFLASTFAEFAYEISVQSFGINFSIIMRIDVSKFTKIFESNITY